ncbi:hypothetical protein QE447_001765 [Stenotrophomonas sp. SORGH_AS282]|nr:hypothetical protein [Stenotrophomonas sp. SORGH_AS_0282]MDQ1189262.1 hypothetical protein [Stenotrophomonas sp. SORGH_AS_0282]
MTIYRRSGGTWIGSTVYARIGSGFAARVVRRRQGGGWVFASNLVLSGNAAPSNHIVGPGSASNSAGPGLSISGGSGNYSYNTVYLSGSTGLTLINPNSLSVYASVVMSAGQSYVTAYRTTAIDNVTGQTTIFDWTVTLTH